LPATDSRADGTLRPARAVNRLTQALHVVPDALAAQDRHGAHPEQNHLRVQVRDLRKYPWMLEPYAYDNLETLLQNLETEVIEPA
jgi:hypothetical protein